MGFFDLFKPQPPMITPILPDAARQEILHGRLPILRSDKIFLKNGENCHYIDKAIYEKRTVRKRYVRHTRNYSTPGLFKGTRHTFGGGHTDQVDNVEYSTHKGILYITNRRLIFVGAQEGFDKRISDIIAVQPYTNCIEIQFSKEQYKIFVPDGTVVHAVLQLVN